MNCPVCGAEVSGEVCTTCGARISGTSSFSLQGNADVGSTPMYNDVQQPAMDDYSDLEGQSYNMGMGEGMNNNMNGYPSYSAPAPKKSNSGLISGIIIAVTLLAVVAIVVFNLMATKKAQKGCEDAIKTFMSGLQEGDATKIASVADPESNEMQSDDAMDQLVVAFQLLAGMGIDYKIDYTILDSRKASESEIKSMCAGIFGDAGKSKDIKRAYIYKVEMVINVSYLGQSESSSETSNLICYERDGHYYIGGMME